MAYDTNIGLEIHAQLLTETKIFCSCPTRFGDAPNENTCPVCLGLPGALPVLNKKAVDLVIKIAASLDCRINEKSLFARKNYFYPDLPKGYQISMYERPLAEEGALVIDTPDGGRSRIGITRIHLEEDAGKSIHEGRPDSARRTYVDFNRCGVPLVEIVTEPDIRSPTEASRFVESLRLLLLYLRACDGNMAEGSLRCDANVSLTPAGIGSLGTKREIKNLNSFKALEKGIAHRERDAPVGRAGGGDAPHEK
jgi:aspartyl-tRNA(Asn)/glutamyl-tRNA(Gln) amidotransferase subunit B